MMRFKRKTQWPPGGVFFYQVPETKMFFDSRASKYDLLDQIVRHYGANKLEIPVDLEARVDDYICRNVPDGFCEGDTDGEKSPFRNLTVWTVEKNSRNLLVGTAYADQKTAESRVAKCLGCKNNLRHMCASCTGLLQVIRGILGRRATPADSFLGVCAATGCLLTAMAFRKDVKYACECATPEECWVNREDL